MLYRFRAFLQIAGHPALIKGPLLVQVKIPRWRRLIWNSATHERLSRSTAVSGVLLKKRIMIGNIGLLSEQVLLESFYYNGKY